MEQALPGEFRDAMKVVFDHLNDATFDRAVEIANLPDMVRGYEELKVRRVADFRTQLDEAVSDVVRSG